MSSLIKPRRLQPGDRVAAISLSWGGPATYPHRYEAGKRQLMHEFGVEVVETRHALRDADWLYANPQARVDDLHEALEDESIAAIVSTIGGDDSIRLLPMIKAAVIRANPKIFMGFSDTTITHIAFLNAGVGSFYGPAFMAGLAENCGMLPYMVDSIRRTLCNPEPSGEIAACTDGWTVEHLPWQEPANQEKKRALQPPMPWNWLQGDGVAEGPLIGGCAELLEMLKGTPYWPADEVWDGAILFMETSEEGVPPSTFKYWLRNYGAMGLYERLNGIVMGRPGGRIPVAQFDAYDDVLRQVVRDEFGYRNLPIVTRMDFGHTDPMFVIPYGATARIDGTARTFTILDAAVV